MHDSNSPCAFPWQAMDTVLTIGCRHLSFETVELLLEYGAQPTRKEALILLDAERMDILKLFVRLLMFRVAARMALVSNPFLVSRRNWTL